MLFILGLNFLELTLGITLSALISFIANDAIDFPIVILLLADCLIAGNEGIQTTPIKDDIQINLFLK